MVTAVSRECNGVKYTNLELDREITGALSVGDKKTVIKGKFSVGLTRDSYKYGSEVQFIIFSPKDSNSVQEVPRNNSGWDRLEFFLPLTEVENIIAELEKYKNTLITEKI